MAICDLPDMYAQSPRAEGLHIRQITNGHVTSIMYHFVPIVTTIVLIPQVIGHTCSQGYKYILLMPYGQGVECLHSPYGCSSD